MTIAHDPLKGMVSTEPVTGTTPPDTPPPTITNEGARPVSNTVRKSYASAKGEKLDEIMEVEIDDTVFAAYPYRVPATVLIDFSGLTVSRDPEAMWNFFRHAMPGPAKLFDGSDKIGTEPVTVFDAFKEFTDSPLHIIEAETLGQIIADMVEFTTGRPTEQSNS